MAETLRKVVLTVDRRPIWTETVQGEVRRLRPDVTVIQVATKDEALSVIAQRGSDLLLVVTAGNLGVAPVENEREDGEDVARAAQSQGAPNIAIFTAAASIHPALNVMPEGMNDVQIWSKSVTDLRLKLEAILAR